MNLVKDHENYNWQTDDAARLSIAHTSDLATAPLEVECRVIGHSGIVRPELIRVRTEDLEFLAAGLFGAPRDKAERQAGWTGDAYKFGVYARRSKRSRHDVVILRTDGGGFYAYIDMSLTAAEMWRHLCLTCTTEMLWNICSCVVHTSDSAHEYGREFVIQAFLEGRLKKRRRRGSVSAFVKPVPRIVVTKEPATTL